VSWVVLTCGYHQPHRQKPLKLNNTPVDKASDALDSCCIECLHSWLFTRLPPRYGTSVATCSTQAAAACVKAAWPWHYLSPGVAGCWLVGLISSCLHWGHSPVIDVNEQDSGSKLVRFWSRVVFVTTWLHRSVCSGMESVEVLVIQHRAFTQSHLFVYWHNMGIQAFRSCLCVTVMAFVVRSCSHLVASAPSFGSASSHACAATGWHALWRRRGTADAGLNALDNP
jgi:hypothetical protein